MSALNEGGIHGDAIDTGKISMYAVTDPATNAATTSTIIGVYGGAIITTTTTGNSQTLASPTDTTAGKIFVIVNNDTSTNTIPVVANSVTYTIGIGVGQAFIWDGTKWMPTDLGITAIPVTVIQGGTGLSTITDHSVMVGSGTGAVTPIAVGTDNQILTGVTGSDPIFKSNIDGVAIGGTTPAAVTGTTIIANTTAYIGDTSNSKSTQGLTINQGANDDEILSLKSSDVNHSFTDRTEADTYGVFSKTSATLGGLAIYGYSDGDYNALYLVGNMGTTDPTDIKGAIEFEGNKLSGTTVGALGAAETVLNVKNRATTLFSLLGDGKANFWKTANDGTNYEGLQIDPATAGNMKITALTGGTGTDNIDITLTPAGTGAVKTGTAEVIDTHYDTIFIPASAMTPTATNGAVGSTAEYATNDINMDYLLFDGATEQFAEFQFPMPENWDRGTIKAKFYWSSDTGSTANDTVEWEIAGGALSNDDAIDAALGTAQVISDALLADNGTDLQVSGATPAITVGGTPALGDLVHFKVSRNVGGTDDMTENARLFGVWIQYKANTSVAAW